MIGVDVNEWFGCDVCGEEIDAHNVTPERGPGYRAAPARAPR